MIGKVVKHDGLRPLVAYLWGPGKHDEHTAPTLLAVSDGVTSTGPDGLADDLEAPLAMLRTEMSAPVWHLSLRLPDGETLTGGQWAEVARDVADRVGLTEQGARWFVMAHDGKGEHVHMVATLATMDGQKVRTPHDYRRIGEACRSAELRHGLTITAPRDGTQHPRPTRPEMERAERARAAGVEHRGREWARGVALEAAASSADFDEYSGRLINAGIEVHPRWSTKVPGQLTGYSVTLPDDGIRVSGSKLGRGLGLGDLQRGWHGSKVAGDLAHLRNNPPDPHRYQSGDVEHAARRATADVGPDVADAVGDALHVGARHSHAMRQAAGEYERARYTSGGISGASEAARALRAAVRAHRAMRYPPSTARALGELVRAVERWHGDNGRHHQAAAARDTAEEITNDIPDDRKDEWRPTPTHQQGRQR